MINDRRKDGGEMTAIPDDVMKAAYVVRRRCDQHIRTDGMSFYLDDDCDEIIARAIMAERERCAKIAKTKWLTAEYGEIADADIVSRLCEDIADEIQKGGAA